MGHSEETAEFHENSSSIPSAVIQRSINKHVVWFAHDLFFMQTRMLITTL